MRALVTGGAGYIGSVTCKRLLERGHEVICVDTGGHAILGRYVREDCCDPLVIARYAPDVVIHLAGLIDVAEGERDPRAYLDANAIRPALMLRVLCERGIPLVCASSAAVYAPYPFRLPEDAECSPASWYGYSKLALEQLVAACGVRAMVLRYFNVCGAYGSLRERHTPETHLIPNLLTGHAIVNGDGGCVRDYVHVLDVADANVRAAEHLVAGHAGGTLNIGTGRGASVTQVVEAVRRVRFCDVTYGSARPGDADSLVADISAARAWGWGPTRSLEEAVADAWGARCTT